MADIVSTAQNYLPNIKIYGSAFISTIAWIILIVLFIAISFVVAFLIIQAKKYKYKIVLFEETGGQLVDTGKDKGMAFKFGDLGSKIMYCRKSKKYIPFPTKESGFRKFYFRNRPDGLWQNMEWHDVPEKSMDLQDEKDKFIDITKSMLYHNTGIRKGLAGRYQKEGIWQKYGTIIISFAFIAIIGVLTWLLFDKWLALANTTNDSIKAVPMVMEKVSEVLTKLDNVCGGKGYAVTP